MIVDGWYDYRKNGMARNALQADAAAVAVHNAPDDGEPQPQAEGKTFLFGSEVGTENFFMQVLWDAGAVVCDGDQNFTGGMGCLVLAADFSTRHSTWMEGLGVFSIFSASQAF